MLYRNLKFESMQVGVNTSGGRHSMACLLFNTKPPFLLVSEALKTLVKHLMFCMLFSHLEVGISTS